MPHASVRNTCHPVRNSRSGKLSPRSAVRSPRIPSPPTLRPLHHRDGSSTQFRDQGQSMGRLQVSSGGVPASPCHQGRRDEVEGEQKPRKKTRKGPGPEKVRRTIRQTEEKRLKPHHIFPIPVDTSTPDNLHDKIRTLNSLHQPSLYPCQTPSSSLQKALNNLNHLSNNPTPTAIHETSILSEINSTEEILDKCDFDPQRAFLRDEFIENFDPDRLGLPPDKPSTASNSPTTTLRGPSTSAPNSENAP